MLNLFLNILPNRQVKQKPAGLFGLGEENCCHLQRGGKSPPVMFLIEMRKVLHTEFSYLHYSRESSLASLTNFRSHRLALNDAGSCSCT